MKTPSSVALWSSDLVPVLDEHVLVSDHHLHLAVVHEVVVIAIQGSAVFVVHELGQRQIVGEDEGADGIVVHEFGFAVHNVLYGFSIPL